MHVKNQQLVTFSFMVLLPENTESDTIPKLHLQIVKNTKKLRIVLRET